MLKTCIKDVAATLRRDWWKLTIIVFILIGIDVFQEFQIAKLTEGGYSSATAHKLIMAMSFIFGVVGYLLLSVLPAFIREQKKFWSVAWQYIALRMLCEVLLIVLIPEMTREIYNYIKWPYSAVIFSLLLGFLCAVANETTLLTGIKNLFTKHLNVLIGAFLSYKLIWVILTLPYKILFSSNISDTAVYISHAINNILLLILIYTCLPLLKEKKA